MKISRLIEMLAKAMQKYGDVLVMCEGDAGYREPLEIDENNITEELDGSKTLTI